MWWMILWLLALSTSTLATWLVAAFVLRMRHFGRLVLSLLAPASLAALYFWVRYFGTDPVGNPGWDAVFVVFGVVMGFVALIAMMPVWFLIEEKLGWRAR